MAVAAAFLGAFLSLHRTGSLAVLFVCVPLVAASGVLILWGLGSDHKRGIRTAILALGTLVLLAAIPPLANPFGLVNPLSGSLPPRLTYLGNKYERPTPPIFKPPGGMLPPAGRASSPGALPDSGLVRSECSPVDPASLEEVGKISRLLAKGFPVFALGNPDPGELLVREDTGCLVGFFREGGP